ncbi:MAG: N-acetylmuramoyl-L-alanine amidase, partial [Firmicutes bacterium]|nr:N-acetylmuramoyl-L-alanine amidase [Bacillota bacterium]
ELVIGSNIALVNDEEKVLDVPAFIIDHDGDYYGSTMIPVRFVAENLSFGVEWDEVSRTVKVSSPLIEPNRGDVDRPAITTGSAVDITTDSAIDETTDTAIETNPGYEVIEGVMFPEYDMTTMPALNEAAKGILIAVDAGHGGRDSGSIGHNKQPDELYEKDVNLAVALRAIEFLEEAGFEVYATRTDDSYIYYKTRAYDSNDAGAYFLVSYHNNSINDPSIKGSLVCYYSKSTEAGYKVNSKSIASAVQSEMVKALGTEDRGISNKKELAVLNKSVMPAIIIEGAFISNEEDFAKMKTQEYAKRYAWASVKAIIESFNAAFPDEEI